jgi:hypothetical protein
MCRVLVGKARRKDTIRKTKMRWVGYTSIMMDLGEIGCGGVDWIGLTQDRDKRRALVNSVMNLLIPQNSRNLSRGYTSSCLSSSAQLHS